MIQASMIDMDGNYWGHHYRSISYKETGIIYVKRDNVRLMLKPIKGALKNNKTLREALGDDITIFKDLCRIENINLFNKNYVIHAKM